MNKSAFHHQATEASLKRLRHMGVDTVRRIAGKHYAIVVDPMSDQQRLIYVRSAHRNTKRHRVTSPSGKIYEYDLEVTQWNLHLHGEAIEGRPDWWILVDLDAPLSQAYIVPDHVVRNVLTVNLVVPLTGRPRRSKLAPYCGAWGQVESRRKAA